MRFSTILTALFFPYIAQERTAPNLILLVRSLCFTLFFKECHRSQNQGSLKSEERFQREMCPALLKSAAPVHTVLQIMAALAGLHFLTEI